jgi:hypothetical protein
MGSAFLRDCEDTVVSNVFLHPSHQCLSPGTIVTNIHDTYPNLHQSVDKLALGNPMPMLQISQCCLVRHVHACSINGQGVATNIAREYVLSGLRVWVCVAPYLFGVLEGSRDLDVPFPLGMIASHVVPLFRKLKLNSTAS